MLRGRRSASPAWGGYWVSSRSSWAIQARPEVPPKDAAAAEISTSSQPTGFGMPAATYRIPPAT